MKLGGHALRWELNSGDHAFRKRNAQDHHARLMTEGLSDSEARLQVAKHLGHNRSMS